MKIHGCQNRFRSQDLLVVWQCHNNEKSSILTTLNGSKLGLGIKPLSTTILGIEYSTLHQCNCVQKMWIMTLFWILSKNRSIIGSRVDPRLGMDRLGVLGQLSTNISMEILRSSKSMIFGDFERFGSVLCYFWPKIGVFWAIWFLKIDFFAIWDEQLWTWLGPGKD